MKIILVGIGGIGISAIAQILHYLGYKNIIGIDSTNSEITEKLKKLGIKIIIGHGKININDTDFVIYSDAAINTPEVKNAKIKFSYFEFIGEISKYLKTIAITGTHGKSTTTALSIYGLKNNETFGLGIVGALIPQFENNNFLINLKHKEKFKIIFDHIITGKFKNFDYKILKTLYFIIEADEFNKHFLLLDPDYAIITNIELDHSDIYKNEQEYFKTFNIFANKVKYKIIAFDDPKYSFLQKNKTLFVNQNQISNIKPNFLFGIHNKKNILLSATLLNEINKKGIKNNIKILENFKGLWRRLEIIYDRGPTIFSDYAHHPTEIKAIYQALKEKYPNKKIKIIFQPHQAQRVIEFFKEFINSLKPFDHKLIYKIYAARENLKKLANTFEKKYNKKIQSFDDIGIFLATDLKCNYTANFEDIINFIKNTKKEDIIVIATAGDLDRKIRKHLNNI